MVDMIASSRGWCWYSLCVQIDADSGAINDLAMRYPMLWQGAYSGDHPCYFQPSHFCGLPITRLDSAAAGRNHYNSSKYSFAPLQSRDSVCVFYEWYTPQLQNVEL